MNTHTLIESFFYVFYIGFIAIISFLNGSKEYVAGLFICNTFETTFFGDESEREIALYRIRSGGWPGLDKGKHCYDTPILTVWLRRWRLVRSAIWNYEQDNRIHVVAYMKLCKNGKQRYRGG